MIVIQILLILGVIAVFGWFLMDPKSHQVRAWTKILGFLFTVMAIIVIADPNTANSIAHKVGVGRGADLLLYLLTLAFLFLVLNLYIRDKEQQKRLVELARKIALLEAQSRKQDKE